MVIAPSGFPVDHPVVLEPVPVQPFLGNLFMFQGPGREEVDVVPLIEPAIKYLQGIGIGLACGHALRFLIWDVVCNGPIDVDEVILYVRG